MVLIIIPKDLHTGILVSQTISLIENIAKFEEVVIVAKEERISKLSEFTNCSILAFSNKKKLNECLKNAKWVYTRGLPDFFLFYLKKKSFRYKYKIFHDFRGLINEESYLRHNSLMRKCFLLFLEKFVSKNADYLGTVSYKFKEKLQLDFKSKKPIYVVPCCISNVYRKTSSKQKNVNLVYIGGLSHWQRFEDVLKIYKQISAEINSTFTVITKDIKSAKMEIKKANINSNVFIKSLSHEEVLQALPNYDFGFLIRQNIPLNNVASPVKFLEYTSNGVIPILTRGIGDFSEQVEQNNIGIVLDSEKPLVEIEEILEKYKDPEIYNKLACFSEGYTWKKFITNHPLITS